MTYNRDSDRSVCRHPEAGREALDYWLSPPSLVAYAPCSLITQSMLSLYSLLLVYGLRPIRDVQLPRGDPRGRRHLLYCNCILEKLRCHGLWSRSRNRLVVSVTVLLLVSPLSLTHLSAFQCLKLLLHVKNSRLDALLPELPNPLEFALR